MGWVVIPQVEGAGTLGARARGYWLREGRIPGPLILLSVAMAYLALAQLVLWLNDPVRLGAGFWPAAGLTTAALLLLPTRRWGWVIAGVAAAELGGDLAHGYPLVASLLWTAGNCLGPLTGAALVRRFVDPRGALVPLRNLVGFLGLGVLAGSVVGASVGSLGSIVSIGNPVWQVWPKYVVGDALGVLVVAPLLLTWRGPHLRRRWVETALLAVGLLVVPLAVFRNWGGTWDVTLPYLVLPLLSWAALRFSVRGAAWAVLWITLVANWATASGYGPFAMAGEPSGHAVTLLQIFLVIAAVSALILAALVDDLSDRDDVERALRYQARHDPLTGLPNRLRLHERAQRALDRGGSGPGAVALLLVDLDDFKLVNDGLGHHTGDEVLSEVAGRLRASVRPGDLVARLGGDEFVVLAEGAADEAAIRALADRLLARMQEPFRLETGAQISVGGSVGVAVSQPGQDAAELLRDADVALYQAKRLGGGRVACFDATLRVEAIERLETSQQLRGALGGDELFCLYQPELVIASGELFGFEALVRWRHPERGLLSPDQFVGIAEDAGLAGPLFDEVLGRALDAQGQWGKRLGFLPPVSVNLSPRQLGDETLPDRIAVALTRLHRPAGLLWLEVTESAMASDASLSNLFAMHDLGVRFAIDDFGTGWSSMSRLSAFPWDALKIDRSFVADLAQDAQSEHVVRAMIVMAHALGIQTIAEGVETAEQLDILTSLGCDVAQGFLFSRPTYARAAIAAIAGDGTWAGPAADRGRSRAPDTAPAPAGSADRRVPALLALTQRIQGFEDLGAVSPDLLMAADPDRVIHAVNPAWRDTLGWGRSELVGRRVDEFVHPGDLPRTREAFQGILAGESQRDFSNRWRHRNGDWRWISWASSLVPGANRTFSSGRDVTRRVEQLSRVTESAARLSEAGWAASIGVWEWQPDTDVAHMSDTLRDLLAWPPDEPATNERLYEMVHPDDRADFRHAVQDALRTSTGYVCEYRLRRSDGQERVLLEHGQPIIHGDDVVRMIGTIQDVTDQRLLQQDISDAQRLESIGRLAGGAAHDLRNHLAAIAGHVEFAHADDHSPERARRSLTAISDITQRAELLTHQMLTLSRPPTPGHAHVALNDAVGELAAALDQVICAGVAIELDLDDDVIHAALSRGDVEQILMNLCANAGDAMPQGGTIRIITRKVDAQTVRLSVADDGAGMDERALAKTGQSGFTTKADAHGTGLGIPAVEHLITRAGGRMAIDSQPGTGTVVQLDMPSYEHASRISPTPSQPRR